MAKSKSEEVEQQDESVLFVTLDEGISIIVKNSNTVIVNGSSFTEPMKAIRFNGAHYRTSDPEEIAHLRKLDSFGKRIFEEALPDDAVDTQGVVVTKFACFKKDCDESFFSRDDLRAHLRAEHSKKSAKLAAEGAKAKVATDDDDE